MFFSSLYNYVKRRILYYLIFLREYFDMATKIIHDKMVFIDKFLGNDMCYLTLNMTLVNLHII